MSLSLGSTTIGSLYLGSTKIGEAYLGNVKVYPSVDPYNPLGLPPNTIRIKLSAYSSDPASQGDARVCVDATNKIWDITKYSNDWSTNTQGGGVAVNSWLSNGITIQEVLGANTSNITNMEGLFCLSWALTSIALFDTRNVTDMTAFLAYSSAISSIPHLDTRNVVTMKRMLFSANALTSLPLFDLSSVTDLTEAFESTRNVQSGALALYQQASTLANVPTHTETFCNCGIDTTTGAAELAQIPSDWK